MQPVQTTVFAGGLNCRIMGLDYGYGIICRREQFWDLMQKVAAFSDGDLRHRQVKVETGGGTTEVALGDLWGQELLFENAAIHKMSYATSLWFVEDSFLTKY